MIKGWLLSRWRCLEISGCFRSAQVALPVTRLLRSSTLFGISQVACHRRTHRVYFPWKQPRKNQQDPYLRLSSVGDILGERNSRGARLLHISLRFALNWGSSPSSRHDIHTGMSETEPLLLWLYLFNNSQCRSRLLMFSPHAEKSYFHTGHVSWSALLKDARYPFAFRYPCTIGLRVFPGQTASIHCAPWCQRLSWSLLSIFGECLYIGCRVCRYLRHL